MRRTAAEARARIVSVVGAIALLAGACVGSENASSVDAGNDSGGGTSSSGGPDSGAETAPLPDAPSDVGSNSSGSPEAGGDVASDAVVGNCDPAKPFANAQAATSLNSSADQSNAWLTVDQLTAFIASTRNPDGGTPTVGEVFVFTRPDTNSAFAGPQVVPLAPGRGVSSVWLANAEKDVYFGVNGQIYSATRSTSMSPFGSGTWTMLTTGAGSVQYNVSVTADEQLLFFDSATGSTGQIYVSQFAATMWGTPQPFNQASTAAGEGSPVVRADGLALYFTSNRTGGVGGLDIWVARRTSRSAPFGSPTNLTELNTSGNEAPAWVSSDDCTIYFARGNTGSRQLYVATRPL
jgi:hypothetical protein